jgi:hypothetical protein
MIAQQKRLAAEYKFAKKPVEKTRWNLVIGFQAWTVNKRFYSVSLISSTVSQASLFKSVLPPRFSQISKILMSAGETPEMRPAWPTVRGRILVNF